LAKDFRNIEYHISPDGEENGVRFYACSILNTKQKELIFNKNKGAIVQIRWEVHVGKGIENLSETFNFTPQFGEFVEYTNLFDYINHACGKEKNMNMKIVDLKVSWQKDFVFKINPVTLELGYLWITDIEQTTKNYKWDNNEWIEI
tara:strand:- start:1153 stop:1590 length:438 start_codon:yes stop_codon:yes gene_type:complete